MDRRGQEQAPKIERPGRSEEPEQAYRDAAVNGRMTVLPEDSLRITGPGLVLRPGDTLLVGISGNVSRAEFEELEHRVRKAIPDLGNVVFMRADALAAYRPDESRPGRIRLSEKPREIKFRGYWYD